jgi:hypothetical protein
MATVMSFLLFSNISCYAQQKNIKVIIFKTERETRVQKGINGVKCLIRSFKCILSFLVSLKKKGKN